MAANELELMMGKVDEIFKQLGGPNEIQMEEKKKKDEFNSIKLQIAETINLVAKTQEERDILFNKEGRGVPVIRLGSQIQEAFLDLNNQLGQMKDIIRRQKKNTKKYPADMVEVKEKQYQKYVTLVDQLKQREEGETVEIKEKGVTLTDLKTNLLGKGLNREAVRRELNDIESEALKRFQKNDEEIDGLLERANEGLDRLRDKAVVMGEALDKQEVALQKLDKEVDKAKAGLENVNMRLKKVLFSYRQPSKFCLDVCLLMSLLGLIAVIIKLAASK